MDALIQVQDLTKTYRFGELEVRALRGVSLTIQRGEFVAIMGPSGSGKSTFMNILGFLDQPTHGEYLLEGIRGENLSRDALAEINTAPLSSTSSICAALKDHLYANSRPWFVRTARVVLSAGAPC